MARTPSNSPAPKARVNGDTSPSKISKEKKEVEYVPNPLSVPKNKNAKDMDIINGDHGIQYNGELQDFLWSMTDEPHASRRKAMIKEMPELKELMGHEWKTKYIVAVIWSMQLGMAYYLREEALWGGTLKFWVIAYVFGATVTSALFLAVHEISHNLAFRKFQHNKLFGIFTNIPMVVPFFIFFKNFHNEHHKYQGVEGVDTDLPTSTEAKYLSSTAGKLFYMFNQTWFYALRPVFTREQPITRWHVLNMVVVFGSDALMVYFWGWGALIYLGVCAHFAGSWHPIASHFIAEHFTFTGEVETASYYGWMNWLTWNVGYHNEHHDFPTVAWTSLPSLREKGKKYYDSLPFHSSWVGALLQFIFDPKITFYNRVKRKQKGTVLLGEAQTVEEEAAKKKVA